MNNHHFQSLDNNPYLPAPSVAALMTAVWMVVGGYCYLHYSKQQQASVPTVPSWIPYIGSASEYFNSVLQFSLKYGKLYNGRPFQATILGRRWYFLMNLEDIQKVFRSPEREISFYQSILLVAGNLFPTEEIEGKHYSASLKKQIFRGTQMQGLPSTPLFVYALKKLPTWMTLLQDAFQYNFKQQLQEEGTKDLFQWCMDLISTATARVLLGKHVSMDQVQVWVQLVSECDLESSLNGSGVFDSLRPVIETKLLGERLIYQKTRKFIYPYIEQEIENYLAGKPQGDSVIAGLVVATSRHVENDPTKLRQAKLRIANDLIFFTFAAITNSYGAAAWALYHILRNTDQCGDKVRAEMKMAFEKKSSSTTSSSVVTTSLTTVERMVQEITRLYTPGNTFRYVVKDFVLASDPSIVIPAGSVISFNSAMIARNPQSFANAERFMPSRFDPDHADYNNATNFFGFGFGAHPCVGKQLAQSEIAIFVTQALQTFEMELVHDVYDESIASPQNVQLTRDLFPDLSNHPILNPKQISSIWRPVHPVYIKYRRRKATH